MSLYRRFRTALPLLFISLISLFLATATVNAKSTEIHWAGCGISKLGFMQDLAQAYEQQSGIKIILEGGGATKGIRKTASGEIDMGGSCRLPLVYRNSDGSFNIHHQERKIKMVPVGWDSLVVITNTANTQVDSISREQLRAVLTGKITNWKALGASEDKPINLYVRRGKVSGVGITLRQQLFNNSDQDFTAHATILPSSGKIEKAVEKDPYALAVSGISSSRHRAVKMLKLDQVEPSIENLQNGSYSLFRILFLVAPEQLKAKPAIREFIQFAHSAKGQSIITQAGTLPYHRGIHLLFSATSPNYLQAIDLVEQSGIYTLSGT